MKVKKLSAVFLAFFVAATLYAQQDSEAYAIMKKADEVPEPTTSSYTATMTLTSKKGKNRVREVVMRSKDYGDTKKSILAFTLPKDVAGVGYLMFEYDDRADGTTPDSDNWLYMPAMKKVRRITGSDKGDDFMGTDFTYEDMGDRSLNKDTYTLLGEESVDGFDCWKIECKAKDKTEKVPRRIVWIRKDNYMLSQAEFYDRQGKLQRTLSCIDIKQIDGFWTTQSMLMKNVQTGHSTLLEMKEIQFNQDLSDSLFTVATLERGNLR